MKDKNYWTEYLGIIEEDTVDENDVEGEWEYVRELRSSDGGTKATGKPDC